MTLKEKLDSINKPALPKLESGFAKTILDYWRDFIEPRLPANKNSVIEWHKLLKDYVNKKDTVLGFRTGNVAGHLRRGWETVTNDSYSFFYTDNYFSHYFYKMSYDGFVPSLDEFYNLMRSREFPVRFASQMGTKDEPWEKEYAAFNVDGKNPGLGTAGYKLAHILDAGKNYHHNGCNFGIAEICNRYFSLGEVSDWKWNVATNHYCREDFTILEENKEIAKIFSKACFLRMVHPMNYFISPKSRNHGRIYNIYVRGSNIAEDLNVLSFIRTKFHERYTIDGVDYFQDFLNLVLPFEDKIKEDGNTVLNVRYSSDDLTSRSIGMDNVSTSVEKTKAKNRHSLVITKKVTTVDNMEMELAKEYLFNPSTSFRKLEIGIMGIESPVRGGGFKAKKIINNLGITAEKKGILCYKNINDEISTAIGQYRKTLKLLKKYI